MKQKLSITLDEETVQVVEHLIQKGVFRNRSHAVEFSVKKMAESHHE